MAAADPRVAALAAAGQIRLGLFLPQYAKHAASGALRGVGTGLIAIEIVGVIATRLGVAMRLMTYSSPTAAVADLKCGACDVAFLGLESSRAADVDFTPPLFEFDYTFLVPADSTIRCAADVDRRGMRIAIVDGHASALALRRIVKHAELVGAELPHAAFELFRAGKADAFALPRDHLLDYSAELPGAVVLNDRYGVNRVAMAVPKGRAGWLAYLAEFAGAAEAAGLVRRIIERGALRGFAVASPPERD